MKRIDLAAEMTAIEEKPTATLTLNELVAGYYARNPTADGHERLRKWRDALGHHDAWALESEQLGIAAEALRQAGYAASSVNRDVSAFGTINKWAKRERLTPRGFISPTLAIRREPELIRRIHLSADEIAALRAGPLLSRSRGFGALIHTLLDSGCRKSEALERRWRDIDLEAGTLGKSGEPLVEPPVSV